MTNEKDRAHLTRIVKQWAATLVGSRHVSSSEVATLAEMLEPLLAIVRHETEVIANEASPIVAQDARALLREWADTMATVSWFDGYSLVVRNLPYELNCDGLEQCITTLANQRYVEGVEDAAKTAENAGTEYYRKQQRFSASAPTTAVLVAQAEQDTADLLSKRIRALLDEEKKDGSVTNN